MRLKVQSCVQSCSELFSGCGTFVTKVIVVKKADKCHSTTMHPATSCLKIKYKLLFITARNGEKNLLDVLEAIVIKVWCFFAGNFATLSFCWMSH